MIAADSYAPEKSPTIYDVLAARARSHGAPFLVGQALLAAVAAGVLLITALRWWPLADIVAYRGPDLFGPRDLATALTALVTRGVPAEPIRLDR